MSHRSWVRAPLQSGICHVNFCFSKSSANLFWTHHIFWNISPQCKIPSAKSLMWIEVQVPMKALAIYATKSYAFYKDLPADEQTLEIQKTLFILQYRQIFTLFDDNSLDLFGMALCKTFLKVQDQLEFCKKSKFLLGYSK